MESYPAQPAAQFLVTTCRRGPTCHHLRRRRCLFFHSEDEIALASLVGQNQPPVVSLMVRIARLERAVAQFVGVPVPQIMEDLVDGVQAAPQELVPNCLGEQIGAVAVPQTKEDVDCERRDSSDAVYRQDCRSACCDAATGPSNGDKPGDQARRDPAEAVHRQGRHDGGGDAATGPSTVAQLGDQARRDSADTQYTDKVVAVLFAIQRQVPESQTVLKTGEAPLAQFIGNVVDVPLISQINQVTKHADIPQKQYIDNAAAVPVVTQRQVPRIQTVSKTVKVPPAQFIGRAVDVPIVLPPQVPQPQTVAKTVEIPTLPFSGKLWMCL